MNTKERLRIITKYGSWYEWGDRTQIRGIAVTSGSIGSYIRCLGRTRDNAVCALYRKIKRHMWEASQEIDNEKYVHS